MATPSTPLVPHTLMPRSAWVWRTGAIFVAAGMMTGAFGAHALRNRPNISPDRLQTWHRATSYAVYNGLGLLLVSLHPRFSRHKFAAPAIAVGGAIFSTSIMALILSQDRFKFIGPVTPLGGMLMIAGYVSLVL